VQSNSGEDVKAAIQAVGEQMQGTIANCVRPVRYRQAVRSDKLDLFAD